MEDPSLPKLNEFLALKFKDQTFEQQGRAGGRFEPIDITDMRPSTLIRHSIKEFGFS